MAINQQVPPLVFFGTGPVAAKSLRLLAKKFAIESIITKPKPAHHRGSAPVLDVASELGITALTVGNKDELDELFKTNPVKSRVAILIDFGIIVSQAVIDYFPLGIINSHFSVLPDLRGADPITFAILSGQEKTGVSLMKVVKAMDEGPLVGYGEYILPKDITGPELTDILIDLSDTLLEHEVPRIVSEQSQEAPQSVTKRDITYSRRLTKEDGRLIWSKPVAVLEREVRAFQGWPGSYTTIANDIDITITAAAISTEKGPPGSISFDKQRLVIYASDGALVIERLKPSGKNEMTVQSFLSGYSTKL